MFPSLRLPMDEALWDTFASSSRRDPEAWLSDAEAWLAAKREAIRAYAPPGQPIGSSGRAAEDAASKEEDEEADEDEDEDMDDDGDSETMDAHWPADGR
mmetsp:Transcript_63629/g.183037  ORF Transcript_63629/g.183037 Transcript_63629/m.183037 type:complete len:99 (+) Transcript_63629:110-406(+)